MNEFKFKKKYGQNFIKDENLINKIVDSAEISKDSLVIEIGPGMGALTTKILNKCKQGIIYEIDIELKEYLEDKLNKYNNYELIFEDFLETNVKNKLKEFDYKELLIVANLPYYISTPIIMKLLEKINREEGTTILMVTHDLTLVNKHRKRTISLENGHIVADMEDGGYMQHVK